MKRHEAGRPAAPSTNLAALLRPDPFDKLQRANELRKLGAETDENGDLGPAFGEDRFFIDYTASLRKSSRRANQLHKLAAKTAEPATFEVISIQGELQALLAQQEHVERQSIIDLIRQGRTTARINALTGARLP